MFNKPFTNMQVKPEVLCVGFNHSYNARVFLVSESLGDKDKVTFKHVMPEQGRWKGVARREQEWYIVGT